MVNGKIIRDKREIMDMTQEELADKVYVTQKMISCYENGIKQPGIDTLRRIAVDEEKRVNKDTVQGKILPLVEHKITEAEAFDVCRSANLLSPAYNNGQP